MLYEAPEVPGQEKEPVQRVAQCTTRLIFQFTMWNERLKIVVRDIITNYYKGNQLLVHGGWGEM
jgi:hypothetical protein